MTQPYSMDLRERAMEALADGSSCRQVAKRFAISVSAVVKWSQRLRQTGSVAPAKMGTTKRSKLVSER
ncbi:MAG: helix-turn-helix domain-containing protein, partial [Pseudomonadota bacterium]